MLYKIKNAVVNAVKVCEENKTIIENMIGCDIVFFTSDDSKFSFVETGDGTTISDVGDYIVKDSFGIIEIYTEEEFNKRFEKYDISCYVGIDISQHPIEQNIEYENAIEISVPKETSSDTATDIPEDEAKEIAKIMTRKYTAKNMTRKDVLDTAAKCVLGDREQDHGTPEDSFGMTAKFWSDYLGVDLTSKDVAMMMALLKITRIKQGGGSGDSYVDLAGYAACAGELAHVPCREVK